MDEVNTYLKMAAGNVSPRAFAHDIFNFLLLIYCRYIGDWKENKRHGKVSHHYISAMIKLR